MQNKYTTTSYTVSNFGNESASLNRWAHFQLVSRMANIIVHFIHIIPPVRRGRSPTCRWSLRPSSAVLCAPMPYKSWRTTTTIKTTATTTQHRISVICDSTHSQREIAQHQPPEPNHLKKINFKKTVHRNAVIIRTWHVQSMCQNKYSSLV